MEWIDERGRLPVKSWCIEPGDAAMKQARALADHPRCHSHIALMPDCHPGYGMPIGGVIACDEALIPHAVGVDIGCGMMAVKTDLEAQRAADRDKLDKLFAIFRDTIPAGEGHSHRTAAHWPELNRFYKEHSPPWLGREKLEHDLKNLGTLGGGNHFLEIQQDKDEAVWLMIHTGSRNLGYRIADYYHRLAQKINGKSELAWLDSASRDGKEYIRDMNFALTYAVENRTRIMTAFQEALEKVMGPVHFDQSINIHHNFATQEEIAGKSLWIHRKGATSAAEGELGIIPGSMGTSSFIVRGKGNSESFRSCSHGAGRVLSRNEACRKLTRESCDKKMEGIYHTPWRRVKKKGWYDLSEAPQAYKDIDEVMDSQSDLVEPLIRLTPLAVMKG